MRHAPKYRDADDLAIGGSYFLAACALPSYDPNRNCPKCGSDGVSTSHHDPATARFWKTEDHCRRVQGEHIDRCCHRCHYRWAERVMS